MWAQPSPFGVNEVFLALAKAYPDTVSIVPSRYNKRPWPALLVDNRLFYWIEGRILAAEDTADWEKYSAEDFYFYPKEVADPLRHSPQWIEYLESTANAVVKKTPRPYINPEFWNTLHRSHNRRDTESSLRAGRFFKRLVVGQERIWPALGAAEAELSQKAESDPELKHFLTAQMNAVYSFSWRTIAKTQKRSTHSYGTSLDTVDTRNRKKATYWLWRRIQGSPWAREPLSMRWAPPRAFIEIMEKYGFAWGGKWNFYDTIHFEYRPDILILNGYEVVFPERSKP